MATKTKTTYLSVQETMKVLDVKQRRTIYDYLKTGELKGVQDGRNWKIEKRSVNHLKKYGTSPQYLEKRKKLLIKKNNDNLKKD